MDFLKKYNHQYFLYADFENRPLNEKETQKYINIVESKINEIKNSCDKIIVSPMLELYFLNKKSDYSQLILPIFTQYLSEFVFKYSLKGKIGFFGDIADLELAQENLIQLSKTHQLTQNQTLTKSFNFPFSFWSAILDKLKYFFLEYQKPNWLTSKLIKNSLKSLKDAMVDTIVPLYYGFFAYSKVFRHFFNNSFHKFHPIS